MADKRMIYAVESGEYEDYRVDALFTSRRRAAAAKKVACTDV
jgi:hypothetical protein